MWPKSVRAPSEAPLSQLSLVPFPCDVSWMDLPGLGGERMSRVASALLARAANPVRCLGPWGITGWVRIRLRKKSGATPRREMDRRAAVRKRRKVLRLLAHREDRRFDPRCTRGLAEGHVRTHALSTLVQSDALVSSARL